MSPSPTTPCRPLESSAVQADEMPPRRYPLRQRNPPARYRDQVAPDLSWRDHPRTVGASTTNDPFAEQPKGSDAAFISAVEALSLESGVEKEIHPMEMSTPMSKVKVRTREGPIATNSLRQHIRHLEKSERRLKMALRTKMDLVQELGDSAERAVKRLKETNEALGRTTAAAREHQGQAVTFRNWWISDHCALEAVLAYVPAHARADVEHVVAASRDRYSSYFTRESI